jgi:hypothetical protein
MQFENITKASVALTVLQAYLTQSTFDVPAAEATQAKVPDPVYAEKITTPKPPKAEKPAPTQPVKETAGSTLQPPAPVVDDSAKASPSDPKPASAKAPATGTSATTPTTEVTYQDVADLVIKYSKANGRPTTVKVLEQFGITALPQAKPEQYTAIAGVFAIELGLV